MLAPLGTALTYDRSKPLLVVPPPETGGLFFSGVVSLFSRRDRRPQAVGSCQRFHMFLCPRMVGLFVQGVDRRRQITVPRDSRSSCRPAARDPLETVGGTTKPYV